MSNTQRTITQQTTISQDQDALYEAVLNAMRLEEKDSVTLSEIVEHNAHIPKNNCGHNLSVLQLKLPGIVGEKRRLISESNSKKKRWTACKKVRK